VTRDDLVRELEKTAEALAWTERHLTHTNEANAAMHCNERIFYSPLTTQVHNALESTERLIAELKDEVEVP
jgi:hypothetical protein